MLHGANPFAFAKQSRHPYPSLLTLPRATFLAQLHRTKSFEEWITHVIEERIELEEVVFIGVKEDLATRAG